MRLLGGLPLAMMPLAILPGRVEAASRADAPRPRASVIARILAVLGHQNPDPTFRAKAADKLATRADDKLHLMTSLSERVAVDGDRPAGGIALFLIAAPLILS